MTCIHQDAERPALDIVIPADPAAMEKVSAWVSELLGRKQWPNQEVAEVELAVHEAIANAIRHGCKNDPSKHIQCCAAFDAEGGFVIVVSDPGPGFDVTTVPSPLEGGNLLKTSGRGVFLIKQMMDTVEFAAAGRQVLMSKRRDSMTEVVAGA